MSQKKKRKKSLIGWIVAGWTLDWLSDDKGVVTSGNELLWKDRKLMEGLMQQGSKKVRITIEEI